MKRIVATLLLAACTVWAQASEAWLRSQKYIYQPGESASISFQTGDNLIGTPWNLNSAEIQKLELHQQSSVTDLKPEFKTGDKENLSLVMQREGTSLVTLEAAPTQIAYTAEQFNVYLKNEELDEVAYNRQQAGADNKPAVERRTRYVKLALQVGEKKDDIAVETVGFPLEIVPQTNPYHATKGQTIRFTVLYKGKPWFGTRVKNLNREDSRTTIQNLHTGKDGTIDVIISNTGPWVLSTTVMEPSREPGVQWQSYQTCYTFGVQ